MSEYFKNLLRSFNDKNSCQTIRTHIIHTYIDAYNSRSEYNPNVSNYITTSDIFKLLTLLSFKNSKHSKSYPVLQSLERPLNLASSICHSLDVHLTTQHFVTDQYVQTHHLRFQNIQQKIQEQHRKFLQTNIIKIAMKQTQHQTKIYLYVL